MSDVATWSSRQWLAYFALSDLPTPEEIHFLPSKDGKPPILALDFYSFGDGAKWAHHVNAYQPPAEHGGRRWVNARYVVIHGWSLSIHASEPADLSDAAELDADTTARLRELVAEP